MNELVRLRVAISTGTGLIAMKFLKGIHGPNRLDLFVDALTFNPAVALPPCKPLLKLLMVGI